MSDMAVKINRAYWREIKAKLGITEPGPPRRPSRRPRPPAPAPAHAAPGRYVVEIEDWHPAPMTELMHRGVRARIRAKRHDRKVVGDYLVLLNNVPRAVCKRRVTLKLVYRPGQTRRDDDNAWKSLLDALKWNGLLVDDGPDWVERAPVEYAEGPRRAAVITLEDPPEPGGKTC